jgi:hypothetical protein
MEMSRAMVLHRRDSEAFKVEAVKLAHEAGLTGAARQRANVRLGTQLRVIQADSGRGDRRALRKAALNGRILPFFELATDRSCQRILGPNPYSNPNAALLRVEIVDKSNLIFIEDRAGPPIAKTHSVHSLVAAAPGEHVMDDTYSHGRCDLISNAACRKHTLSNLGRHGGELPKRRVV